MQKQDSQNRKSLLKKERNQIKNQLLSDKMMSKLKTSSHRERSDRRLSGPFRVIQTSGTTVHSETSFSKGTAGTDQEIKSITTRTSRTHSVVNILSETSDNFNKDVEPFDLASRGKLNVSAGAVPTMKKTLLMREHALAKRRKKVEELLRWHKKLLDEEKAIEDLESKITTIISKIPSQTNEKTPKKSKSLSALTSDSVSKQETGALMSQLAVERAHSPATNLTPLKTLTNTSSETTKNIPQEEINSEDSIKVVSSANYSADFDNESAPQNSDDHSSVSSISQLIEDFSKIEDNILNLALVPKGQGANENENFPQDEAKSDVSSHSTEAASQIEAKKIISDKNDENAPGVIIEEPSEHLSPNSDQQEVISSLEIEEVVSEASLIKDNEVTSDNAAIFSVSEELIANNVPDDNTNKSCSVENITLASEISEKRNGSSVIEDDGTVITIADESSISEVAPEIHLIQDSFKEVEESNDKDKSGDVTLERDREAPGGGTADNEAHKTSEETQISSHGDGIETEQSRPSVSQENEHKTKEDEPITSHYSVNEDLETQFEEPTLSPSKDDISTSKQYQEIEDYAASNLEQPSTSRQDTGSPVLSLSSKEDITNIFEEKEHDSVSSESSRSAAEVDLQLLSVIEDDRQSFENKTDEEKAASLSGRSSGSNRGTVSGERRRHSLEDGTQPSTSASRASGIELSQKASSSIERTLSTERYSKASGDSRFSEKLSSEEGAAVLSLAKSETPTEGAVESVERSHISNRKDSTKETSEGSERSKLTEEKSVSNVQHSNSSSEITTVASQKSPSSSSKSSESSDLKSLSVQKPVLPPQSKSPADIRKHVQEILNVSSPVSRGDKSPRMQDLCVMTYDTSPAQSPESGSPMDEKKPFSLGSEAEEIQRKYLAIEQEIKLLKEQQQKEAASPFYIREIPNKPPPPYTPPSKTRTPKTPSVIPATKEEIEQITEYSAKIIHKAYLSSNLDNITISDNTLNLIAKNIDKGCYKYVFDLCKEVAKDHYSQFEDAGPSWLQLDKKPVLAPVKPLDVNGLKRLMSKKLLEMFGFEKQISKRENAIVKWSRKKRDHVDEVLLQEMQIEEPTWTNFDKDEALVKDRVTNEIMEMLLRETAQALKKTMRKKSEGL